MMGIYRIHVYVLTYVCMYQRRGRRLLVRYNDYVDDDIDVDVDNHDDHGGNADVKDDNDNDDDNNSINNNLRITTTFIMIAIIT
jgi:hypothetical protein